MQSTFEVRVDGVVHGDELGEFATLVTVRRRGTTLLRCALPSQPALAGLVARMEDLGLRVVEMRRLPPATYSPTLG